jgi:hypothetical protein
MEGLRIKYRKEIKHEFPRRPTLERVNETIMESRSVLTVDEPLHPEEVRSRGSLSLAEFLPVNESSPYPDTSRKRKINAEVVRLKKRRKYGTKRRNLDSVHLKSKYDVSLLEGVYTILTLKRVTHSKVSSQPLKQESREPRQETQNIVRTHGLQHPGRSPILSAEAIERAMNAQNEVAYKRFSEEAIRRAIQVLQNSNTVTLPTSSNFSSLDLMVESMIKRQILRRLYLAGWNRRNVERKI